MIFLLQSILQNKLDAIYQKACGVRQKLIADFEKAFSQVDVIITPILLDTPRPIDGEINSEEDRMNDLFTSIVNLAGLPAISIPLFIHEDGLPIALQIIGNHYDEYNMFKIAKFFESNIDILEKIKDKILKLIKI